MAALGRGVCLAPGEITRSKEWEVEGQDLILPRIVEAVARKSGQLWRRVSVIEIALA